MKRIPTVIHKNALALRKRGTDAENLLWFYLRAKRLGGIKFKRQMPIPPYIVDFCSESNRLVIELDGGGHGEPEQERYDLQRDAFLVRKGYEVVRIWNTDVFTNLEGVLELIMEKADSQ